MKVKIVTDGEIRTTIPVILEIQHVKNKPLVSVKQLGIVPVVKKKGSYKAEFWTQEPGNYLIEVKDGNDIWKKEIFIKKQEYLNFSKEFGFFTILFIFMMVGVYLWMKKIGRKSD